MRDDLSHNDGIDISRTRRRILQVTTGAGIVAIGGTGSSVAVEASNSNSGSSSSGGSSDTKPVTRKISNTTPSPGETITVSYTASISGSPTSFGLSDKIKENTVDSVSFNGYKVNGSLQFGAYTNVATNSEISGAVASASVSDGDTVTVEYDVTVPNEPGTHTFDGSFRIGDTNTDLSSTTVTVTQNPIERNVSNLKPSKGESITIEYTAVITGSPTAIGINDTLSPDVTATNFTGYKVNGETQAGKYTDTSNLSTISGAVSSAELSDGDSITIAYEVTVPSETGTHTFDGSARVGENPNPLKKTIITVTENKTPVQQYENDETGTVDETGLRKAITDFAANDANQNVLREVILRFVR